jgi:hypothetical protein
VVVEQAIIHNFNNFGKVTERSKGKRTVNKPIRYGDFTEIEEIEEET